MARKAERNTTSVTLLASSLNSRQSKKGGSKNIRYEPAASRLNTSVPPTPSAVAAEITGSSSTIQ